MRSPRSKTGGSGMTAKCGRIIEFFIHSNHRKDNNNDSQIGIAI